MSKRRVIELSTGRKYNSAAECGRATGIPAPTIIQHCTGRIKEPRYAYYSPYPREQERIFEEQRENIKIKFAGKNQRPHYHIMFLDDKILHPNMHAAERYYNYGCNTINSAFRRGRKVKGRDYIVYDENGNIIKRPLRPLTTPAERAETRKAALEKLQKYNDKRVDNLYCVACLNDLRVFPDILSANKYYQLSRTDISASISQERGVFAWRKTNPQRRNYIRPTYSILAYLDIVYLWDDVESRIDGLKIAEKAVIIRDFYKAAKEILYSDKSLEEDGEVVDLETGEIYQDIQTLSDHYKIPYKSIWLALINGAPCVVDNSLYWFALVNPKYDDYRESILTQKNFFQKSKIGE